MVAFARDTNDFYEVLKMFQGNFWSMSDKREMELKRVNNVDDEEESMHLYQDLKLVWR